MSNQGGATIHGPGVRRSLMIRPLIFLASIVTNSITLNLKSPEGRGILGELLGQADVIIENFKPGTLAKWGFSEDWFEANAPKVVHCSITGYGDKGPKGGMPGYDFLQAESGLMSITGEEGGGPQKLGSRLSMSARASMPRCVFLRLCNPDRLQVRGSVLTSPCLIRACRC